MTLWIQAAKTGSQGGGAQHPEDFIRKEPVDRVRESDWDDFGQV